MPVKHGSLLWIPGVCFIHAEDRIISMGINQDDGSRFTWNRHSIDGTDLKPKYILPRCVPGNGLALADVSKKMMFLARGYLLKLQIGGIRLGAQVRGNIPL